VFFDELVRPIRVASRYLNLDLQGHQADDASLVKAFEEAADPLSLKGRS
jgi:hypothetical protein